MDLPPHLHSQQKISNETLSRTSQQTLNDERLVAPAVHTTHDSEVKQSKKHRLRRSDTSEDIAEAVSKEVQGT